MRIWIDADACPGVVRDIVIKAAMRNRIAVVFVANKKLAVGEADLIEVVTVDAGPDIADKYIAEHAHPDDLVVTQDIPLAYSLVKNLVVVINPRGDVYSEDNIGERISVRDLCQELRDAGEIRGGLRPYGEKEKRAFASSFDRELMKLLKKRDGQ